MGHVVIRWNATNKADGSDINFAAVLFDDGHIAFVYGAGNAGHSDWRDGFLCLATLRPDGFAGYEPDDADRPAVVLTTPLTLGARLSLSADALGVSVIVRVVDEQADAVLQS